VLRSSRSNPLDGLGRMPDVRAPMMLCGLAAVVLAAYGVRVHWTMTAERAAAVERFVAEQGLGPATASPRNRGCGRSRSLYDWRGPKAHGTACAGPRGWVELREVVRAA
jgi:hypothetical protein